MRGGKAHQSIRLVGHCSLEPCSRNRAPFSAGPFLVPLTYAAIWSVGLSHDEHHGPANQQRSD